MSTSTTHRVAIVTGASSGIGQAIAEALAASGHHVIAVARRQQNLDALASRAAMLPGTITPLAADVTQPGVAATIVQHTLDEHGHLDILVNAAGYGINKPSETMTEPDWDDLFNVNFNAVAHLTTAALPALLDTAAAHGIADVITIGSTAGLSAEPGAAAYSASKHAIRGLMEAWRKEYATRDIRFTTINPGAIATEFGSNQQFIRDWYTDMQQRGAVALPEDIARTTMLALELPARTSLSEITLRPTRQP